MKTKKPTARVKLSKETLKSLTIKTSLKAGGGRSDDYQNGHTPT